MTEDYDPVRAANAQRDRYTVMRFALTMQALRTDDRELLRTIGDMDAAQAYDGDSLGQDEFLGLIGVEPGPDGLITTDTLINACMGIHTIPAIQALPTPERVRTLATAIRVLDHAFTPTTPSAPATGE